MQWSYKYEVSLSIHFFFPKISAIKGNSGPCSFEVKARRTGIQSKLFQKLTGFEKKYLREQIQSAEKWDEMTFKHSFVDKCYFK